MIGDAGCLGNIGEGAVVFVAIKRIGCADQSAGAVHDVQAAPHSRVGSLGDEIDIKVDVIRHVEVEVAVVVVVAPRGTRTPAVIVEAGQRGMVGEGAVASVLIEAVGTVVGDIEVWVAVVVVVGGYRAHTPACVIDARSRGNILEGCITGILVEGVAGSGLGRKAFEG